MRLFELLDKRGLSAYKLSKMTGIPYTTINDLLRFKTSPSNITLGHALKLSEALDITVEQFAKLEGAPLTDFEFFRSNLLQDIRILGPMRFVTKALKEKTVDFYFKNGGTVHALYLLGLIDYEIRIHRLPIKQKRYNDLRKMQLDEPFFTSSSLIRFSSVDEAEQALGVKVAPEFRRNNIIEVDIAHTR